MTLEQALKLCLSDKTFSDVSTFLTRKEMIEMAALYCFVYPDKIDEHAQDIVRAVLQELWLLGEAPPLSSEIVR